MTEAAGSVWNKNSWHWEEKDYGKWARNRLIDILASIELEFCGHPVVLRDISPSGFATISVRKGKKIVSFEYEISCSWECDGSSGKLAIPEFSQEALKPTLRVSLASGSEDCKEYLRKSTSVWEAALKQFHDELQSSEGSAEALETDKSRRAEELAKAKTAEAEKGEEKRRINEQVKASEVKPLNETQASVWNVNAYHWETRRMEKPAAEWLTAQLTAKGFGQVQVNGEAEVSIRKGKKIVIFDLKICTAEFSVSGFNQEDEPRITWKEGPQRSEEVKVVLKGLADELRSQS